MARPAIGGWHHMTNTKLVLEPDTTLYPVPVVLISCGIGQQANVFSLNRIASCNAEPPMVALSVRPGRASHALIDQAGEFVVNLPGPEMELISDFVGTTSARHTDKWTEAGLTPVPGIHVQAPLIAECPVNLECQVRERLRLPSHTLFVAEVLALHADPAVLNARREVDYALVRGGLPYRAGPVRERPIGNIRPEQLLEQIRAQRSLP